MLISIGSNDENAEVEKDRSRVFENRGVRKIIGSKMQKVKREW
jgi:hypothetical protein